MGRTSTVHGGYAQKHQDISVPLQQQCGFWVMWRLQGMAQGAVLGVYRQHEGLLSHLMSFSFEGQAMVAVLMASSSRVSPAHGGRFLVEAWVSRRFPAVGARKRDMRLRATFQPE